MHYIHNLILFLQISRLQQIQTDCIKVNIYELSNKINKGNL